MAGRPNPSADPGAQVVRGIHPGTGETIAVRTDASRIAAVETGAGKASQYVSPGWIDLQVNGFAGADYNDPHAPAEEISRSIDAQRSTGVARLYPTVITGSEADMRGSLRNLAKARRTIPNGSAMLGFHVEGPWISPEDGPRGAHPRHHVRPPSIEEFERLQDAAEGGIRIVTLGPEHDRAPRVIEHMAARGVVVSIGHTNASSGQIADAVAAGATMSTHLGNGAHASLARHDNYIVHQMADDRLYAGLIIDGIHLPPPFARIALRAKGTRRSILVTDAVAPAHCEPGIYQLGEQQVELLPERRVELTSTRRLAGSALSMDQGVQNAMRFGGLTLLEATRLAASNPGAAMGLEERAGYLAPGQAADFTLFRQENGRLTVIGTVTAAG
ncbi:MAG: N-acetylglucosamine-6-phosphate deacetylase [Bryobacterales bacterium]|nr:N-acetylglucosamine-6-phosphate deacetylase [Bryobacterales bacterium]